ncbi:Ankyrin repeat domain-containing protein [Plasmodiophora brassicae]
MSIGRRIHFSPVLRYLVLIVVASGIVGAVKLRSNDGVVHVINTSAAIEHSDVLKSMIHDRHEWDAPVTLTNISNADLLRIVNFIESFAVHEVDRATEWVQDMVRTDGLEAQCRLFTAASFLGMYPLKMAIVSTKRTWGDIVALRRFLHAAAFWFVVNSAPGIERLRHVAHTDEQHWIVKEIQDVLVLGRREARFVNNAAWHGRETLLHWSAVYGEHSIIELLLGAPGIDVNARDSCLKTPLHSAICGGHGNIVELLLRAPGVDVNAQDDDQSAPLHWAVVLGHIDIVEMLLRSPAIDVNARGEHHLWTPLLLAATAGNAPIVEVLLKALGIDANARDDTGATPLHWAVLWQHTDVVRLLVDFPGIDRDAEDETRLTAIDVARMYNYREFLDLVNARRTMEDTANNVEDGENARAAFDE